MIRKGKFRSLKIAENTGSFKRKIDESHVQFMDIIKCDNVEIMCFFSYEVKGFNLEIIC